MQFRTAFIVFAACSHLVLGSMLAPKKSSLLEFDAVSAKNRPVSKVITLMKDMLKQMEKEAEEDQEIYDKMACWCETNLKTKKKVIKKEEKQIANLDTKIGQLTGQSSELNTGIKKGKLEVSKDEKSLDQETAQRGKQQKEFTKEEMETIQAIAALKAAIISLSKHNSMLQVTMSKQAAKNLAQTLQQLLSRNADVLKGVLLPSHRHAIGAFIQSPEDFFSAAQTKRSGAPSAPSGEIFGILKQMKETFETNLANSQKEELTDGKDYDNLRGTKTAQIQAGESLLSNKKQELATTDEKNVEDKQDKGDTEGALAEDTEFLSMVKEKCGNMDKEFELRQKGRQLEMEAVSKALSFLTSDDAHDLFTKTFNPSLLQAKSETVSNRRIQAAALLREVAAKYNHPRLATIAMRVRLDAFAKVKKAISDMVSQLLREKEDEIKKKDFCVEEFNKNEVATDKKTREKTDLASKIDDLEMTIKGLTTDIADLNDEVADLQVQLKRAGEDREKQNKEFQETIADQRATQKLLTKAGEVLKGFYNKKAKAVALVQVDVKGDAQANQPAGFKTYKKSGGSGGVMGMIDQIINDAKAMEAEAIRDEEDGQKAYEEFVKDSNASIKRKSKKIMHKSGLKAKSEAALVEAKEDEENVMLELEQINNYKAELHSSCDFITKNFEIRQTARDEEVEALKQAQAILSGSKFNGFLQKFAQD